MAYLEGKIGAFAGGRYGRGGSANLIDVAQPGIYDTGLREVAKSGGSSVQGLAATSRGVVRGKRYQKVGFVIRDSVPGGACGMVSNAANHPNQA